MTQEHHPERRRNSWIDPKMALTLITMATGGLVAFVQLQESVKATRDAVSEIKGMVTALTGRDNEQDRQLSSLITLYNSERTRNSSDIQQLRADLNAAIARLDRQYEMMRAEMQRREGR